MKKNPLVSIVITFLNAEKFLEEAISSVFEQTYDHWELLLVDDGSTDESTRIAQRHAQECPEKICYLEHDRHENRGASTSRNLGIRSARGEYLAFLDSDDVWFPHKLEQQISIMIAQPEAAIVYGPSQFWYSWTGQALNSQIDYIPKLGVEADTLAGPPKLLTLSLESKAPTPCPSNMLLRSVIVRQVGGFEEKFAGIYQLYEDQAFLAKVYLIGSVFVASECWVRYRQHEDSCVSIVMGAGKKYEAGLFYLSWLEGYIAASGITDSDVWIALRKKQRRYRYPKLSPVMERLQFRFDEIKKLLPLTRRAI